MSPKYSLEIDCGGAESDYGHHGDYGFYSSYGTIVAEGSTLDELLETAMVDIQDQWGGELTVIEAQYDWMQDLIINKFMRLYGAESE